MKIVVDGDAFPAKEDIINLGKKNDVKVVLVFSIAHYSEKFKDIETFIVDNRSQEADIKIMNLVKKGDVVLTNDIGLSAVVKGCGAEVINSKGDVLSGLIIDSRLHAVHLEKKARRKGKGKVKITGPKKYTIEDKEKLLKTVEFHMAKAGEEN
jgi:uncharacterized protein YaiI (UPF0178 family)